MPFSVRVKLENRVDISVLNKLSVRFWQDFHMVTLERQLEKQGSAQQFGL